MSKTGVKQQLWQLHLSTVLVLSLVSGLMLWGQTTSYLVVEIYPSCRGENWQSYRLNFACGWPLSYRANCFEYGDQLSVYESTLYHPWQAEKGNDYIDRHARVNPLDLACDAAVGIVGLGVISILLELFIRRRKGHSA